MLPEYGSEEQNIKNLSTQNNNLISERSALLLKVDRLEKIEAAAKYVCGVYRDDYSGADSYWEELEKALEAK